MRVSASATASPTIRHRGGADSEVQQVAVVSASVASATGDIDISDNLTNAVGEAVVAVDSGTTIEIPTDPNEPVEVTTASGIHLEIGLPGGSTANNASTTGDGTVVYTDALPQSSVAVQPVEGGDVQALVVIEGESAPTHFAFPLRSGAESTIRLEADGSATILDGEGELVGTVHVPWATDNAGVAVPTHFAVEGSALVQVVDHTSASFAYPIVADPRITVGWGVYVYMNGREVKYWWSAILVAGGTAAIAGCEGLGNLPSAVAKLIKALCVGIGGPSMLTILQGIQKAQSKVSNSSCYEFKAGSSSYKAVTIGNCSSWP